MKKLIVIMLVAVLCIGILAGCNKNTDKTVIQLNEVTHSVFYAPLYVAINKGYFAEENIEIVLTNGGGSDKTMTAILSGAADIGLLGPRNRRICVRGRKHQPRCCIRTTNPERRLLPRGQDGKARLQMGRPRRQRNYRRAPGRHAW